MQERLQFGRWRRLAHAAVSAACQCVLKEIPETFHMVVFYAVWYNDVKQHNSLKGRFARNAGSCQRHALVDSRSRRDN
jgi:hypothetical protein